jgi:uncharacterized integral membrane protein
MLVGIKFRHRSVLGNQHVKMVKLESESDLNSLKSIVVKNFRVAHSGSVFCDLFLLLLLLLLFFMNNSERV